MAKISDRINQVKENIADACARVSRDPSKIKLVIVTKSTDIDNIKQVIKLGYADLGENRVQQLRKVSAAVDQFLNDKKNNHTLPEKVNWHLIGHLQRNKVKYALQVADLIHSVDTLRLAEEISACATKLGITANILLQTNTSNEPQKYGVPVGAATHLAEQIVTLPNIKLFGLMTMAPLTRNADIIRACFERTAELFHEMKGEKMVGPEFKELSMGMSSDYQMAVENGATILRIGSAIFTP